jgi:hypothetical protein
MNAGMIVASRRVTGQSLYRLAERARRYCVVDSASLSAWEPLERCVKTLVNAGRLAGEQERWPENEVYPLDSFPAVAALVEQRRPYIFTPDEPGDVASQALAAGLQKKSQAGAPVMLGDRLWGQLWIATHRTGRALSEADGRRLEAAAELVVQGLRDIGLSAPPPLFRLVVRGRVDPSLLTRFDARLVRVVDRLAFIEVARDPDVLGDVIDAFSARRMPVVRSERVA